MIKEEIRERIARIDYLPTGWRDLSESAKQAEYKRADRIIKFLHENGMERKIDRDCSYCKGTGFEESVPDGNSRVCSVCLGDKTHLVLEPLIEVE